MSFTVGDRVTNGSVSGTVEAVFGTSVWVLIDGQGVPTTVNESAIQPLVIPVFEVGKTYKQPQGDGTLFTIVFKIDSDNFIAWVKPPGGGNSSTIAKSTQRASVVEA